ncbi:MAG: TolC family protein, partial [Planctomycetes bacterium]|nr:TolC family protein [Planctomycetota bacterium]
QSSFSTGTVTLLDVLQAQEALSRARLEHAEIVVHYNTTQVELLAALGMIDGDRLALTSVIIDQ